jgi:hypothetical protein
MSGLLAAAALVTTCVLAVALVRTRARLARVEASSRRLEDVLRREVEPALAATRRDVAAAAATARDAAVAAGVAVAPPRLPFEPVAGRVVRAVAFGASARRAVARMASPWALGRDERRSA